MVENYFIKKMTLEQYKKEIIENADKIDFKEFTKNDYFFELDPVFIMKYKEDWDWDYILYGDLGSFLYSSEESMKIFFEQRKHFVQKLPGFDYNQYLENIKEKNIHRKMAELIANDIQEMVFAKFETNLFETYLSEK